MRCPYCKRNEDRVIDSRSIGAGNAIRRRRSCMGCGRRFTTYERPELPPLGVRKKDGSGESFSRDKVLGGLFRACEKRNISLEELEGLVSRVEAKVVEEHESGEVSTKRIGELVSEELKGVDHVAYVRFASVYRDFKDVNEFLQELVALAPAEARSQLVAPRLEPPPGSRVPGSRVPGSRVPGSRVPGSRVPGSQTGS